MRFPRPDVREQIRRLAVRAQLAAGRSEAQLPPSRASEAFPSPPMPPEMSANVANSGPAASAVSDRRRRARELEPLSVSRFGVHFTADAELRDLIERARALASHRLPNGDLAGLMKLMAACFVRQEEKRRFGIGARPRRIKAATEPVLSAGQDAPPGGVGKHARYVPVTVRRTIHTRDGGQCTFVSAEGRRCSARAFLELDHRKPFCKAWRARRAEHTLAVQIAQFIACAKLLRHAACCRENRREQALSADDHRGRMTS